MSWCCPKQSEWDVFNAGVSHGSILKVAKMDLKREKWTFSMGFKIFGKKCVSFFCSIKMILFIMLSTRPWMILEVIKVKKVKFLKMLQIAGNVCRIKKIFKNHFITQLRHAQSFSFKFALDLVNFSFLKLKIIYKSQGNLNEYD